MKRILLILTVLLPLMAGCDDIEHKAKNQLQDTAKELCPLGLGKISDVQVITKDKREYVMDGVKYYFKLCLLQASVNCGADRKRYEYVFLSSGDNKGHLIEKDTIYYIRCTDKHPEGEGSVAYEMGNMSLEDIKNKKITLFDLAYKRVDKSSHITNVAPIL